MNRTVVFFFAGFFVFNIGSGIQAKETTTYFGGNYAQIAETINQ